MNRLRKFAALGVAGVATVGVAGVYAGYMGVSAPGTLGGGATAIQASCASSVAAEPAAATHNPTLQAFAYSSLNVTGTLNGCAYNEAKATIYNANTNAVLSSSSAPHTITSGEASGGAFSIPLDNPVNAGLSSADIRIALLIESTTTHDAVTNISGTAAYYGISLTWTAPNDDGGIPPNGYKIEYAADSGGSPGAYTTAVNNTGNNGTSYGVGGLTPGTQYWFRITAWNSHGLSPTSAQAQMPNGVVPYTTAGAPTGVSASTGGSGVLNASWTAPASNGYSNITGYRVEVRWDQQADSWFNWNTVINNSGSTATSASLTGLVPGRGYYVRVSAINAAGNGNYGTSVTSYVAGS